MSNAKEKFKLTQKYLKECLHYDPDTGIFTWNERPIHHFKDSKTKTQQWIFENWNKRFSGNKAGSKNKRGYIYIQIDRVSYRAHRLAFLYIDGYNPEHDIDHINRIIDDNRWSNLRHVHHSCNMKNAKIYKTNTSGVVGVRSSYSKFYKSLRYVVQIKTNQTGYKHLGTFSTIEEAAMARWNAETKYNYPGCRSDSSAYLYLKERGLVE